MPKLLSGQVLRQGGSGEFIALPNAQPALGPSPSTSTGFTLITSPTGITSYSNILGNIAFSDGALTNNVPGQDISLQTSGTGTFVVNSTAVFNQPVLFNQPPTFTDLTASGQVRFTSQVGSDAYNSGTLVVSGGVGIGENLNVNGILGIDGQLLARGTVTLSPAGADVYIQPSLSGSVYIEPSLAGAIDNMDIGLQVARNAKFALLEVAGGLLVSSTVTSTSTNSGSLIVRGGMGVAGSIYSSSIFDNSTRVISQVTAGVGLSGGGTGPSVVLTNTGVLSLTAGTGTFVSTSTGDVVVWTYGNTLQQVLTQGNTTTISASFNNPIEAISLTTASVVTAGGLAVAKNLLVGTTVTSVNVVAESVVSNNAVFTNTQVVGELSSTSTLANNSMFVVGGSGFQGDVTIGGNTFMYGNLTVLGTQTVAVSTIADLGRKVVALSTSAGPAILSIDSGITVGPINSPFVKFFFDGINSWKSTGNVIPNANNAYTLGKPGYHWSTLYTEKALVTNLTQSTNSATGALIVSGGVGIGLNLNVGGAAKVSGTLQVTGKTTILDTTSATNVNSGALQIAGGLGVQGSIYAENFYNTQGASFVTTATINQYGVTHLVGGTDTVVTTSTGAVIIWSTATLQSITSRSNTTDQIINFTNTTDAVNSTTGAVVVAGGLGVKKNLYVGGDAVIYGNVTFAGEATNVLTTNTVFTDNLVELHKPSEASWTINDGKDIGVKFHYFDSIDKFGFLGRTNNTGFLEWYSSGVENPNSTFSGVYGTIKTGSLVLADITPASSTTTGALIVAGGVGIGGALYVTNQIYVNGSPVLTSASLDNFGVSTVVAGTDTAVTINGGDVTIWNTSTFDTVTHRGNVTTSSIYIANSLTVTQNIVADSLQLANTIDAGAATFTTIQSGNISSTGRILTTSNDPYPVKISSNVNSTSSFIVNNISSGTDATSAYIAINDIGNFVKLGINSSNRQLNSYDTGTAYLFASTGTGILNIGNNTAINIYTQGASDLNVPTLALSNTGTVTLVSDLIITDNDFDPNPHSTIVLESSARVGYTSISLANTSLDGQRFTFDVGGADRASQGGAAINEGNFTLRDDVAGEYRFIVTKVTGDVLIGTEIDDGVSKLQVAGNATVSDNFAANTGTFNSLNINGTSTFHEKLVILESLDVASTATFHGGITVSTTATFDRSVVIGSSLIETTVTPINTVDPTSIDSFDITLYRSAKSLVQVEDSDTFHLVEIVLLHDNSGQVYKSEYGIIATGNPLGEFTAAIDSGQLVLYFTAYDATNKTVNVVRTTVSV